MKLSVIIVSYNTREMTLQCLRTLFPELEGFKSEVFVVDNASRDGSVAAIRGEFPEVLVIENPENSGFGAANNLAMERAIGKYFLLLNSDAFPRPGAIQAMFETFLQDEKIGVVGPKLLNRDGSLQRSCWRFPSPTQAWIENLGISSFLRGRSKFGDYRRWEHDNERDVDFLIGACLMVKRDVYEHVGGFDPAFWMYAEETDWQRRMHELGYTIRFTPKAEVEHWGGASGAGDKAKVSEAFFNSLDLYTRKHHGFLGLLSLRTAMIVGNGLRLPLWMSFLLAKRNGSREKLRLSWWLLRRQSTKWRLERGRPQPAKNRKV